MKIKLCKTNLNTTQQLNTKLIEIRTGYAYDGNAL